VEPAADTGGASTDYLYCPVCRVHVACQRVPSGGWEVACPGCDGECALCHCYLKRFCFGSRELFPPFEDPDEVRE
jgi:hypothetical protein